MHWIVTAYRWCRCAQPPANRWHPSGMNTEQTKSRRSSDPPPKVLVEPDKSGLLRGFAPSRAATVRAKADRVEGDRAAVAVRRLGSQADAGRVRQHPTPLRRRRPLAARGLTRRREAAKGKGRMTLSGVPSLIGCGPAAERCLYPNGVASQSPGSRANASAPWGSCLVILVP